MESLTSNNKVEREILTSKIPVLVEFYSKWCGPCQVMKPVIKNIQDELGGKVKVLTLDIEKNRRLANKFAVLSLPTSIIYRDGKRVKIMTGIRKKHELISLLQ